MSSTANTDLYLMEKRLCQLNVLSDTTGLLLIQLNKSVFKQNVSKIKKDIPILFVSGDNDPVGNNGEGVKKSYEIMKLIGSIDVTMKLFEGLRHEVLNELNKDEVFEYILNWYLF